MVQVLVRDNATDCGKWIDHDCLDKTVTYSFTEVNGADGDGIITINIIGTENPSGTEVMNTTLTLGESESDGVHLTDDFVFDATTGILTIQTVNDLDESAATPLIINLETWLQNQIIGGGATTVTWNGSQFVIASEDDASTMTLGTDANGNNTWTYQAVDNDGNTIGAPVVITDTNTTNTNLSLNSANPAILELTDSDGNILSIDLTNAFCAIMQAMPEETC